RPCPGCCSSSTAAVAAAAASSSSSSSRKTPVSPCFAYLHVAHIPGSGHDTAGQHISQHWLCCRLVGPGCRLPGCSSVHRRGLPGRSAAAGSCVPVLSVRDGMRALVLQGLGGRAKSATEMKGGASFDGASFKRHCDLYGPSLITFTPDCYIVYWIGPK
ncbi:hypothetical protein GWI33_021889, partial [Rhynchophorus ferrugineus]